MIRSEFFCDLCNKEIGREWIYLRVLLPEEVEEDTVTFEPGSGPNLTLTERDICHDCMVKITRNLNGTIKGIMHENTFNQS